MNSGTVEQLTVEQLLSVKAEIRALAREYGGHEWPTARQFSVMQNFRSLLVWRRSHDLVLGVRRAIKRFPRSERGSLKSQMVNSAESIAFNIVEDCGARSSKEFARFLDISIKSTCELEGQLQLATDAGLMQRHVWSPLSDETEAIRRMLCGLRKKVLSRPDP